MLKSRIIPWLLLMWVVGLLFATSPVLAQQPRPSCYAAPLGTGTVAKKVEHISGDGWYHFCVTPTGVSTVVTARANGYRLIVPDVSASAPIHEVLHAVWDANVSRKCDAEGTDTRIGAICKATFAAAAADPDKPKLKAWRVAPNPQSTSTPPTRPMWDSTGAKAVSERAVVGELCDCSKQVKKGTQTLCPLSPFKEAPATGNLAACVLE